jgi:uncharacterized protein (DUF2147 family)
MATGTPHRSNRRGLRAGLAAAVLLLTTAPVLAADPIGEWMVADGVAKVRIENCGDKLWGVISWEKVPGGTDKNNPDPSKQSRPTLGMPILLGMQQTAPNRWEGEIYNAENGKTYSSNISLADNNPDLLQVRGCVLGFLCGGQDWPRVEAEPAKPGTPKAPAPRAKATPPRTTGAAQARTHTPPDPTKDVCASIAEAAGPANTMRR